MSIQISCIVGGKRVSADVVKTNKKTVWVRIKDRIIKRHWAKHSVSY